MTNKGLWVALTVCAGLAGGAIVGGLDDVNGSRELSGYRPAVSPGPECPDDWECAATNRRGASCICLTRKSSLPGEVSSPPESLHRQIQICRQASGKRDYIVRVIPHSQAQPPEGFTCRVVVGDTLVANTYKGIQTEVEESLASQCGLPVTSATWYCCPHCLLFADGCPPCPQLCAYWENWKGHEAECNQQQ